MFRSLRLQVVNRNISWVLYLDSIEIPIYYEAYFPDIEEVAFDVGRQLKLISVRKGVFSWGDLKIEGKKSFVEYIQENSLINKLIGELKIVAKGKSKKI